MGELCCARDEAGACDYEAEGDCADAVAEYMSDFVRPVADLLAEYATVPVVLILEPDSLPNLVTNAPTSHGGNKRCGDATRAAYTSGITQAVGLLREAVPRLSLIHI